MYPYFRAWAQVRRRLDPMLLFSNVYMERIFANSAANISLFTKNNNIDQQPQQQNNVNVTLATTISNTNTITSSALDSDDVHSASSWSSLMSNEMLDVIQTVDDDEVPTSPTNNYLPFIVDSDGGDSGSSTPPPSKSAIN